jgi:hypothetical protein
MDDGWKAEMESRLDAQATHLVGVNLDVQRLVNDAQAALNAIVNGVAGELTAFKQVVHVDHDKMDTLVGHLQQKFQDVEGVVQELAAGSASKFLTMDAVADQRIATVVGRAAHAEQRIVAAELRIAELMSKCTELAAHQLSAGLAVPTAASPPRTGGFMASAGVDPGHDAWAAAAAKSQAAAAASLSQPPGMAMPAVASGAWPGASTAQYYGLGTPLSGKGPDREPREFRVDYRAWGNHGVLDTKTAPAAYLTWRDRALGFLCRESPEVRRLLIWSESQSQEGVASGLEDAATELGVADISKVDYILFEAIRHVVSDPLLTRSRACEGRGVELWRRIHCEWKGSAPQLKHANAGLYLDPVRLHDAAALWEGLVEWERLGDEVESSGLALPEWTRITALHKLLPATMLETLVSRHEVATYTEKIRWVRCQMEHTRGASQAKAAASARHGRKDAMDVSELRAEVLATPWSSQEQLEHLCSSLLAMSKGNGKGGKGKGAGKGGGVAVAAKGSGGAATKGGSAVQGADYFDGLCNHCGKHGHRKFQCRTLDKELAAKGKGKGLRLLAAEEDGQREEDAEAAEGEEGEEWCLGGTMYSLEKEGVPEPPSRFAAAQCCNQFCCLSCDEVLDEMEVVPALVAEGRLSRAPAASVPLTGTPATATARGSLLAQPVPLRSFSEAEHLQMLVAVRAKMAAEKGGFTTVERSRPKGATIGDCITAARSQCSQRARRSAAAARFPQSAPTVALNTVQRDLGGLVGAVSKASTAGMLEAVVDSGAEESVAPKGFFRAPVLESPMSRVGGKYRAANGTRIANLGQQKVHFRTAEGHAVGMEFQVAEVERPLISVAQLTSAGNSVVLGETGGSIVNAKTGKTIELVRRGGVYLLMMNMGIGVASGFPRQGK